MELDLSPCQSIAGTYMRLVRSLAKEGKSLFGEHTLQVRFISEGLATTMHANCTRRSKRFQGHKTKCGQPVLETKDDKRYKCNSRFAINQRLVIGTNLCGLGYYEGENLFSFLYLPYMSFRAYEKCEMIVGEKGLEIESIKVRKEALKQEIELTNEFY